tara:strand:- start:214 stop:639 length:426 start_codon:yes stop_codon:yes gene_type:complete
MKTQPAGFTNVSNRRAVDKSTAMAMSGGANYTKPGGNPCTSDSKNPILMGSPCSAMLGNPVFKDITGVRRGRLVAIGIAAKTKKRWVVRCDCGTYSLRSVKAMLNKKNDQDRCGDCSHLAFLKMDEYHRRTGKNQPWGYFE